MPRAGFEPAAILFAPRSVAIVGQSDDAGKTAGRPLKFLRHAGYAGRIYPVNPRRETVLGERAWSSLAALPEPPEHVHVVTPTEAAVEAVAECGRLGVKVATVLADGFAEAGPEAASPWAASSPCEICCRSAWPRPLTGGLSRVMTATAPCTWYPRGLMPWLRYHRVAG